MSSVQGLVGHKGSLSSPSLRTATTSSTTLSKQENNMSTAIIEVPPGYG